MPVPQPLMDALNAVQEDADAVVAAQGASDTANAKLTQAQQDAQSAAAALTAAKAHEATDLTSVVALLQQTYGS